MTDSSNETVPQKDKISILLSEYTSLRTEIQTRTVCMYQLIAAFAALLLWAGALTGSGFHWIVFGVEIIAAAYLGRLIARDIDKAAKRLLELEIEINQRAGETLLVWETLWGGKKTGYYGSGTPLSAQANLDQAEVTTPPDDFLAATKKGSEAAASERSITQGAPHGLADPIHPSIEPEQEHNI